MVVGVFLREFLREWWELMGCAAFTILGVYSAGAHKSNAWAVGGSAALAVLFLCVASFRAWKRQYDACGQLRKELDAALRKGPQVWLGLDDSDLLTVENRSKDADAVSVSIDPIETTRYRTQWEQIALLRCEGHPRPIRAEMLDKKNDVRFVDEDIPEMLRDSSDSFECCLDFTIRFSTHQGSKLVRRATLKVSRLLVAAGKLPEIVNHPIERDCTASKVHTGATIDRADRRLWPRWSERASANRRSAASA